jgi:hypothetical protein
VSGEVDDHVGSLAGGDQKRGHGDGLTKETSIGPDLRERQAPAALLVGDLESIEARLGSIDDSEPVPARLDVHIGPDLRVHDRDVTEELRDPLGVVGRDAFRGVEHASVGVERLVLEHEGDLVRPGRKPERIVRLARVLVVADQEGASQPRVDVRARVADGVVVVPDHARALLVVVGERVRDEVGPPGALPREPLERRSVELRMVFAAVEVGDDAGGLARHDGPEERRVVGQKRIAELVSPFDGDGRVRLVVGAVRRDDRRPQVRQSRLGVV